MLSVTKNPSQSPQTGVKTVCFTCLTTLASAGVIDVSISAQVLNREPAQPEPDLYYPNTSLPPDDVEDEFVMALDVDDATSGLDPFLLAAKSWKLIGGAEALRGLVEECCCC